MWQLAAGTASYESAAGQLIVDLIRSRAGICSFRTPAASVPLHGNQRLLCLLKAGHSVREAYVRGDDVVASYPAGANGVAYEVYWRGLPSKGPKSAFGIELLISAQTDHLMALPEALVASHLESGVLQPGNGWHLARFADCPIAYLEMAHPSNHQSTETTSGPNGVEIKHILFPGQLEKGVIRRSRIRAFLVSPEFDGERAEELYDAFLASPLPLTT